MDGRFEFSVSSPVKIEGAGVKLGYWKYRVDTNTTFPNYTQQEYGSYRRYSDFAWLRKCLVELNPGCLVPPLPEKDVREGLDKLFSGIGRSSDDHSVTQLHEFRKRALRKFLVRVGAHPKLASSSCLQDFIELDEDQFEKRQKEPHPESVFKQGSAVKQFTSNIQLKLAKDVEALTLKPAAAPTQNTTEREKWNELQRKLALHEGSFNCIKDRFEALSKKRKLLAQGLPEITKAFTSMKNIDHKSDCADGWGVLAQGCTDVASIEMDHQRDEVEQVTESLTYYGSLCRSAQGVVVFIKQLFVLKDVVADDLASKRKKREKATTPEAQRSCEDAIQVAIQKQEEVEKLVHDVVATFEEELQRFDLEKQHDFKSILKSNVDLTVEYGSRRSSLWEPIAETLQRERGVSVLSE